MKTFLIWLDAAGKEVRRAPKGRGRPPKDAVHRDDGNFYIQEGVSPLPKSKVASPNKHKPQPIIGFDPVEKPPETQGGDSPDQESQELAPDVSTRRKRRIVARKTWPAEELLKKFLPLRMGTADDGTIILESVVIVGNTEIPEIAFNALYPRMEIDVKSGEVRVFHPGPPELRPIIIENAVEKKDNGNANGS